MISWKPEIIEIDAPPVSKELKKRWSYFIRKVYETDITVMFLGGNEKGSRGCPDSIYPGTGELFKGVPKKLGQADSEDL
jgi:hypothetical protein